MTTGTKGARADKGAAYAKQLREAAQQQLEQLTSEAGFQAWIAARQLLGRYSFRNQLLIAIGALQQGFTPTFILPAWKWRRLGYHPRKGTVALRIFVGFDARTKKDRAGGDDEERTRFRLAAVFDASQVIGYDGTEPPGPPPVAPVDGDELWPVADAARAWAAAQGIAVVDEDIPGGAKGSYDSRARRITLNQEHSVNARFAVLVHELVHAQGIGYEEFDRAECEAIVETTAMVVCGMLGLDTSGQAVPYVARWGKQDALAQVTKAAELIDATATVVAAGILDHAPESWVHGRQHELAELAADLSYERVAAAA
jgi:antirestriction protein ArdC